MKMENKDELSKHLRKNTRPVLENDYFIGLFSKVMGQIKQEPKTRIIPLYKKPLFWLSSAAASILLLFGMNYFLNGMNEITFESLSKAEVHAYVEKNIDDFDEELVIEVLSQTNVVADTTKKVKKTSQAPQNKTIESISFESLSSEEILEYLNSQEMSIEELEETIEL